MPKEDLTIPDNIGTIDQLTEGTGAEYFSKKKVGLSHVCASDKQH